MSPTPAASHATAELKRQREPARDPGSILVSGTGRLGREGELEEGGSMRKALIPAFLLVVAAIVLGSTVFREQIVSAATTPFQNVVVQNTNTNPIPVQQVGTSTTSVSGTVGIDPGKNTVKLDSGGNTVNLDSTDSGHLANIEDKLGKLNFDSSGNLETTAQTSAPGAVIDQCLKDKVGDGGGWDVNNDNTWHTICSEDVSVTDIIAAGMDDSLIVQFLYNGNVVLVLDGSSAQGTDSYQLDLAHPIHIDQIQATCFNSSTSCKFSMAVLGSSAGS
jgi:hypothetical protein